VKRRRAPVATDPPGITSQTHPREARIASEFTSSRGCDEQDPARPQHLKAQVRKTVSTPGDIRLAFFAQRSDGCGRYGSDAVREM